MQFCCRSAAPTACSLRLPLPFARIVLRAALPRAASRALSCTLRQRALRRACLPCCCPPPPAVMVTCCIAPTAAASLRTFILSSCLPVRVLPVIPFDLLYQRHSLLAVLAWITTPPNTYVPHRLSFAIFSAGRTSPCRAPRSAACTIMPSNMLRAAFTADAV